MVPQPFRRGRVHPWRFPLISRRAYPRLERPVRWSRIGPFSPSSVEALDGRECSTPRRASLVRAQSVNPAQDAESGVTGSHGNAANSTPRHGTPLPSEPRGGSSPLIRIPNRFGPRRARRGQDGPESRRLQGFRCRRRRVTVAGADPREGTLGRLCHENRAAPGLWHTTAAATCGRRSRWQRDGATPTSPGPWVCRRHGGHVLVRRLDGTPWRPSRWRHGSRHPRTPARRAHARRPLRRDRACGSGAACRRCLLKACERSAGRGLTR